MDIMNIIICYFIRCRFNGTFFRVSLDLLFEKNVSFLSQIVNCLRSNKIAIIMYLFFRQRALLLTPCLQIPFNLSICLCHPLLYGYFTLKTDAEKRRLNTVVFYHCVLSPFFCISLYYGL